MSCANGKLTALIPMSQLTLPHEHGQCIYLQCIASNSNYYFSVDEMLLISSRAQVNLLIFKQIGKNLVYAGGTFEGVGPIIYTKLSGDSCGRVRGHFERLVPFEEVERLRAEIADDRTHSVPRPFLEHQRTKICQAS